MPCIHLDDILFKKFSACCNSERDNPTRILEAFMEKYCHDYSTNLPWETEVTIVSQSFVLLKSRNFFVSANRDMLPDAKVGDKVNVLLTKRDGLVKYYKLSSLKWEETLVCDPSHMRVIVKELVK